MVILSIFTLDILTKVYIVHYTAVFRIRIGFNADPDPAFKAMWIQIQGFDDQKLKNIYSSWNKLFFLDQKLQVTYT